jgi:phage FluMu protein Com
MKKILEALMLFVLAFIDDFINFCAEKCPECKGILEFDKQAAAEVQGNFLLLGLALPKKCPECGWRTHEPQPEAEKEPP